MYRNEHQQYVNKRTSRLASKGNVTVSSSLYNIYPRSIFTIVCIHNKYFQISANHFLNPKKTQEDSRFYRVIMSETILTYVCIKLTFAIAGRFATQRNCLIIVLNRRIVSSKCR